MIAPRTLRRVIAAPLPTQSGITYRSGMSCPICGGTNWWIGRFQVECGFCQAVLGLAEPVRLEIVRR